MPLISQKGEGGRHFETLNTTSLPRDHYRHPYAHSS